MTPFNYSSFDSLLRRLDDGGFNNTCLPRRLQDGGISFLKRPEHAILFSESSSHVFVFISTDIEESCLPQSMEWLVCESPTLEFALVHNALLAENEPQRMVRRGGTIHKTAIIGADGLWLADTPEGGRIRLLSKGDLFIGNGVDVGAMSIIHHGLVSMTALRDGVKIGAHCSIGHDTLIGENCILSTGVTIGGCCDIDDDVFFGLGAIVKSEVSICSRVLVGAGAVVVKDITEPGRYVGVPARKMDS